jgi:hypothetical protein
MKNEFEIELFAFGMGTEAQVGESISVGNRFWSNMLKCHSSCLIRCLFPPPKQEFARQ